MYVLYPNEHTSCRNYEKGPKPLIELLSITKEHAFVEKSVYSKIMFLLHGELSYSCGTSYQFAMEEKQMLFLPHNCHFTLSTEGEAKVLIVRLSQVMQFCENFQIENLLRHERKQDSNFEEKQEKAPFILPVNDMLARYLDSLVKCIDAGLRCKCYFETKIKELFYLFRAYYSKEELALFFDGILSPDSRFLTFVMSNYHQYKTLSELAESMGMSLSNVEKYFTRIFGMSGYKWMNKKKAENIYHALCTEDTPLKELSMRFEFSSTSSFNAFCKNQLGAPPGAIRRKKSDLQ